MKKKRMPKGCRLVTAIGFSPSGKYIAASDAAEKITVYLFAVEGGVNKVADVAINMKIVHLAFSPHDDNVFATAGKDHVAICTFDGKDKIKNVKGKPGKGGKIESQCSASFANDPKYKGTLFTGGSDGKVYVWKGDQVEAKVDNNKGIVHSVAARIDSAAGGEVVLVGGNDKTLTVYKFDGKLSKMWQVACDAAPRSVDLFNGNMLLGLKNGSVVELPWSADGSKKPNVVMTSHCDGECWGLDVIDLGGGDLRVITSGDDNRILAFNPKKKMALAEG